MRHPRPGSDRASAVTLVEDPRTRWQLVRLLFEQFPKGLVATLLVAVGVFWVLWSESPRAEVGVWAVAMATVWLLRLGLAVAYRVRFSGDEALAFWRRCFVLGAGLQGLVWASTVLLLNHSSDHVQLFVFLVIAAMVAGGVAALGADLLAFSVFAVPMLVSPVVFLVLTGDAVSYALALLMVVFLGFVLALTRDHHRVLSNGWNLHFHNLSLVQGLEQAQRESEQMNQRLEEERDRANAANVAKSQFLANMSHEVRTPMNGVLGMLELLQTSGLNQEQREYADTAAQAADSMVSVLNDILDIAKIEAGRIQLECREFDVAGLLQSSVKLYRGMAADKGLDLRLIAAPDLPSTVCGDALRLGQVLNNLISNALKFTERGFVELVVEPGACGQSRQELCFTVRDSGIGLNEAQIGRLFEAFSQAETGTARRFGGTGLGLAISQSLVGLMDGSIKVQSQPGEGASFSFNAWFRVGA